MKKFRVGFLIDDLTPSCYLNEKVAVIDFARPRRLRKALKS